MRFYRWTAAAMAALLTFSAAPAVAFAEEPPAKEQAEGSLYELGGELLISGRAAVGTTLEADLSEIDPSWITEDDLWFQWFRTSDSGDRVDLSTDSSYTPTESDLESKISLWISGNPDRGFSGGLSASTYPVKATEEEALAYAAEQGDEDAIAELGEQSSSEEPAEEVPQYTEEEVYFSEEPAEVVYEEPAAEVNEEPQYEEPVWDTEAAAAGAEPESTEAYTEASADDESWIEQAEEQVFLFDENGNEIPQAAEETGTEEAGAEEPAAEEPAPVEEAAPSYSAEAYTNDESGVLDFGTLQEGQTDAAEEQFVTIQNTGSGELNFDMIAPENFMVEDIMTPLEPADSVTVWIIPRAGLDAGEYEDTITYTTQEGAEISFVAKALVEEAAAEETGEEAGQSSGEDGDYLIETEETAATASSDPEPAAEPEVTTAPETAAEPEAPTTAEPTDSADPTIEPIPTAEPEATPTAEQEPTAEPEVTPTAEPEPTEEPEVTPTAEPEPSPTEEPEPSPTEEPEPTPTPTEAPIARLTAVPGTVDFGVKEAGYSEGPAAQTVTISNQGNMPLTLQQPSASAYVIGALSGVVLAPGEEATFTLQPAAGLAEGSYTEAIHITGAEGGDAVVEASFAVTTRRVILAGIRTPDDLTGLLNGTPKTAEAMGLPETVQIETTNGSMKANVVWDVNGSAYDPSSKTEQTFQIRGAVQLPEGIENPDNIPLYTSIKVSVNGRANVIPDASGNQISGIAGGTQYTTETKITFTATGAGMDNASPIDGDVRYVPLKWHLVDDRTWDNAPYTATFRIAKAGTYTVSVTFDQQKYAGGSWTSTGVQDVKEVSFTVNSAVIVTSTPTPTPEVKQAVATGDDTNIQPFVIVLIAAAVVICGVLIYLFTRKKR